MKFRKKPVVIEAVRFDGDNYLEVSAFTKNAFVVVDDSDRVEDPEIVAEVWDELHHTWVGVKLGQWIIRGVQGEYYPCDANVFEQTYEPVED